jgi:uncharacterized protein YbbC (DUF1343 family)
MNRIRLYLLLSGLLVSVCLFSQNLNVQPQVVVGSERLEKYLPIIENKRVALVTNHTSLVNETHLVDTLLSYGIDVRKIFSPEHGFRGQADAGEHVGNHTDEKTGLPVISLYGKNFKPRPEDLADIDIVIFDIQDVGVRFYTYLSTMHYVMEACAENGIKFLLLDRPNPNGYFIDGPVLDMKFKSFVGMHPIPLVHGMTLGELANMINTEGWLKDGVQCELEVISCEGYTHTTMYRLPVKPSPNLPNMLAVYLYPSLGLFEGTIMSVGRGTEFPFQVYGHPNMKNTVFSFTPVSLEGFDKNPLYKDELCRGVDLRDFEERFVVDRKEIILEWLQFAYRSIDDKENFFNPFFNRLIGNDQIADLIKRGAGITQIRRTWEKDVAVFKKLRKKYLLYTDFE